MVGSRHSDNAVPVPGLSRVSVTRVGHSGDRDTAGGGRGRVTPPLVLPRSISGPSHISCVEMTAINYRRGWGGGARPGRRVL